MNSLEKRIYALKKARQTYLLYKNDPEAIDRLYLFEKKDEKFVHWVKTERNRLLKFKNIHAGEDCFIIGNGPSLNKMDLTLLNNYYTFGLNKIFLIFKRVQFGIDYLVSVNPLVMEQSEEEFQKIKIPIFLSYTNINTKINKDNIYYLSTLGGNNGFKDTITDSIHESGTVTYIALQIAYYMGFKRVFLIGIDHNFVQEGKPNTLQKLEGEDLNHFDPNYFSGKNWHLADLRSSEYGYSCAKLFYEYNDKKVYDATVDGKLTIFDKITFEEAINNAKKKNK